MRNDALRGAGVALLALLLALPTQAQQADADTPNAPAPPTAEHAISVDDRDVPGRDAPVRTASDVIRVDDSDAAGKAAAAPEAPPPAAALRTGREGAATAAVKAASGEPNPYPDGRDPAMRSDAPVAATKALRTTTADGRPLDATPGTPVLEAEAVPAEAVALAPKAATARASGLALEGNAPNPVGDATRIAFSVPTTGPAQVEVFDARGRLVAVPFDGVAEGGVRLTARLDARALAAGTYVYTLSHGGERLSRKLQVAR